jgi:uncharacterized protein
MTFGVMADVHGNFDALHAVMARHPDVPFWLCVGDLASRTGAYPQPPLPLYWIKGNNEDFDRVEAFAGGYERVPNLHYLSNGVAVRIGPVSVAGLGGTFAPRWYETAASELPSGTPGPRRDDKRRHFVREDVERCKALRGIDVFLTHEAPRPYVVAADAPSGRPGRPHDAGKTPINEVLAAMRPRLHLCGHHHRFSESIRQGIPSVVVDRVSRSYLLVNADTLRYQLCQTPQN